MKEIPYLNVFRDLKERNPDYGWIFERVGEATHLRFTLKRRNKNNICALTSMAFTHGLQNVRLEQLPEHISINSLHDISTDKKWHSHWKHLLKYTQEELDMVLNTSDANWIIFRNVRGREGYDHMIGCIRFESLYAVWDTSISEDLAREYKLEQNSHFGIVSSADIMRRILNWHDSKKPLEIACFKFK